MMRLTDFDVLSFDCYGTLIDWESGMLAGLRPLIERLDSPPDPETVLQTHARLESAQQAWTPAMPYSALLAVVYRRIAEEWGLSVTPEECARYGASVADWPAFPDSAAALARLARRFRLVILSNVDQASFAASNARLGVRFDAIFTAEDIGSYKPSDRNFEYMLQHLGWRGIGRGRILHVAESLFHDHVPATRHGLARCWIHRRHDREGFGATMDPGERPEVDFRFTSLAALADACDAEAAG